MALLETVPLTYTDIKANISARLQKLGYDTQFEGSNISILTDVLSYIASMVNLNTAFNTSEMLLTSATQEKNVRSIARQLGYEGQNTVSYQYKIRLKYLPDPALGSQNTTKRSYSVPKYTKFISGSKTYYSISELIPTSLSNYDITNYGPFYLDIVVKEGTLYLASQYPGILRKTISVDSDGLVIPYLDIALTNVEDDGIDALLSYTKPNGDIVTDEPWGKVNQFLIDADSNMKNKFMRIEDINYNTPRIYFKIATIGNDMIPYTQVDFNVITSSGIDGIASGNMSLDTSIQPWFELVSQSLLVTGQNREDYESVRTNAPIFHNSANRAVVKGDYISICNRHASVKYSQVWGGEDELPKILGNVIFSFVPQNRYNNRIFTSLDNNSSFLLSNKDSSEINFIKNSELYSTSADLAGNVINPGVFDILHDYSMGLDYIYRNPIYMDFDYYITVVKHNAKISKAELQQNIFNIINDYFLTNIEQGECDYFNSNVIKKVDIEVTDLSGLNITTDINVVLYNGNINTERDNLFEKNITFFLSLPYDNYYTDTGVIVDSLPTIYGDYGSDGILEVDFTNSNVTGNVTSTWQTINIEGELTQHSEIINGVEHYTGTWGNMSPTGPATVVAGTHNWTWTWNITNKTGVHGILSSVNLPVGADSLTIKLNGTIITEGQDFSSLIQEGNNVFSATLVNSIDVSEAGLIITATRNTGVWETINIEGELTQHSEIINGVEHYTGTWGNMSPTGPATVVAGTHNWTWNWRILDRKLVNGILSSVNLPVGADSLTIKLNGTIITEGQDFSDLIINGDNVFSATLVNSIDVSEAGLIITATKNAAVLTSEYIYFPILLKGVVVGQYLLSLGLKKYIRIDLYVNGVVGTGTASDPLWINSTLHENDFNNSRKIKINYPNNNFRIIKNTFPRLSSVTF